MYKPPGTDRIYTPLCKIEWNWGANAVNETPNPNASVRWSIGWDYSNADEMKDFPPHPEWNDHLPQGGFGNN